MIGNNNRINPLGTLTRAEMAVLFSRLDEKVDSDIDEDEVRGEVIQISEDRIKISVKGKEQTFEVSEEVIVYDHDDRIPFSKITVGSYVVMELKNDVVVYIEVIDRGSEDDKIIYRYEGTVVDLDTDTKPKEITLQNKQMLLIFKVIDSVKVWINGKSGDFEDIKAGDAAVITVDRNNRAREIRIERKEEKKPAKIKGIITSIDLSGTYHITVSDVVYGGTRYRLNQDADVFIDREEKELDNLVVGMYAELTLDKDDNVIKIEVETVQSRFKAKIVSIDEIMITVKMGDGTQKTYLVSEDIVIRINGKSGYDIDDLEPRDEADFRVVNNTITRITIN